MTAQRPDDRLFLAEIAELIGTKYDTVRVYASRSARGIRAGSANFPKPSGHTVEGPHNRPWWYRRVIESWHASRPRAGGGVRRRDAA